MRADTLENRWTVIGFDIALRCVDMPHMDSSTFAETTEASENLLQTTSRLARLAVVSIYGFSLVFLHFYAGTSVLIEAHERVLHAPQ